MKRPPNIFLLVALAAIGTMLTFPGTGSGSSSEETAPPPTQRIALRVLPAKRGERVLPANFALRPGVPIVISFYNSTREFHTFTVPKLGISALIRPGSRGTPRVTRVTLMVRGYGVFSWYCVFCARVHLDGVPMGGKVYAIIGGA